MSRTLTGPRGCWSPVPGTIVQRLACCMVKDLDHAEARIRELYADFADLAVEHIGDSRVFPGRKLLRAGSCIGV
jgi:hypothetical protein